MNQRPRALRRLLPFLVLAAPSFGCRCSKPESDVRNVPAPVPSSDKAEPTESEEARSRNDHQDLVGALSMCELEHQGRLLDFGTDALLPWSGFRVLDQPQENVTRDAATYLEVSTRELSYDFWLDEPLDEIKLAVRGRAGAARRLGVVFDGKRAPAVRLPDGEAHVFDLPKIVGPFPAGLHHLTLQFGGA